MTEINQNIEGSTIHGSVVAAESIKDSFNTIEKADIKDDLKEQLQATCPGCGGNDKRAAKRKGGRGSRRYEGAS